MFSINYKITEIETKLYKSCYKVSYKVNNIKVSCYTVSAVDYLNNIKI